MEKTYGTVKNQIKLFNIFMHKKNAFQYNLKMSKVLQASKLHHQN